MRNSWIKPCGLWMGIVTAAALLAGCSDSKTEAPAPAPAPAAAPAPVPAPAPVAKRVVDQLFSLETLGMNLAYVEKIAGPAMRTEDKRHVFRTDGCDITLIADKDGKVIESVEVNITPSCDLAVKTVLTVTANPPETKLNALTFGEFDDMVGGNYYADCLSLCGNAMEPYIALNFEGSRLTNFVEYAISAPMVDDKILDATSAWQAAMSKAESEHYVVDTRFNCEPERFRDVIAKGMKNAKPTVFRFGRGIGYQQGDCK